MIQRKRIAVPPAVKAALEKKGRDKLTERQRATGHFLRNTPVKRPTFSAYKRAAVRAAINALCNDKCGYCESPYAAVVSVDIEHYRPKGAVLEPDGSLSDHGYYWLAAEWTNLLPSCPDCNRERKQVRRAGDGKILQGKSGKANKFPLAPGSPRARKPNQHKKEVPLLLDPLDPETARVSQHLEFTDMGFARPCSGAAEKALPRGETTIDVCGLNREGLINERRARIKLAWSQMHDICDVKLDLRESPGSARKVAQLERHQKELDDGYMGPTKPYVGLLTQLIRSFQRVLSEAETYLDLEAAYKAAPNSAKKKSNLEKQTAHLERFLQPDRNEAYQSLQIMDWMGVPIPDRMRAKAGARDVGWVDESASP